MDDLIAFLNGRLNEDEAAAKAAAGVAGPAWKAETYWPEDESTTRTCVRSDSGAFLADLYDTPDYPDLAAHIARHDPARVLREVEAGRRILGRHGQCGIPWGGGLCDEAGAVYRPCPDLRDLLYRWADHPAYRQEWAP
jgi:hypothetical protein